MCIFRGLGGGYTEARRVTVRGISAGAVGVCVLGLDVRGLEGHKEKGVWFVDGSVLWLALKDRLLII